MGEEEVAGTAVENDMAFARTCAVAGADTDVEGLGDGVWGK